MVSKMKPGECDDDLNMKITKIAYLPSPIDEESFKFAMHQDNIPILHKLTLAPV